VVREVFISGENNEEKAFIIVKMNSAVFYAAVERIA
jgi:hypothetical protein